MAALYISPVEEGTPAQAPETPGRKFGMKGLAASLLEESGLSGEADQDVKTVEILVVMHSEDGGYSEGVGLIPCETYVTQAGICGTTVESPSSQLHRVKLYKSVTDTLRPTVHNAYHARHVEALQSHIPTYLKTSAEGVPIFQKTDRAQANSLAHQYLQLNKTLKPTILEVDRIYSDDKTPLSAVTGVFIVGTNFLPHITKKFDIHTRITPENAAAVNAYLATMGLHSATVGDLARDVIELQSLNILNVSVLDQLTTSILGYPFDIRQLDTGGMAGMVDTRMGPVPIGEKIKISTAGTNIPHYTNVKLSHLRQLFKILGFEKIINFDDACRLDNPVRASYRREQEKEAQEFEEGASTPRWKPGQGGKRRTFRKQRKRSRRFHKKS